MSSPQLEIKRNMKKGFKKCITALTPATLLTAGLVSGAKKTCSAATAPISGTGSVPGITDDFTRGVDISALTTLEKSETEFPYPDGSSGDVKPTIACQKNTYTHLPKSMQHVLYPHLREAVRRPDAK